MAQNTEVKVLKISLLVVGLLWLILGLSSFFAPAMIGKLIVGNQVDLIMFRLIGGLHIALGIGTLMVYSKPEKQGIFVLPFSSMRLSLQALVSAEAGPSLEGLFRRFPYQFSRFQGYCTVC